jgi:hypothetical protein
MKKQLLALVLLTPTFLFAQTSDDTAGIVGIFLGLAIFIGLFFLFRGILLWYWRVNDVTKNHDERNQLLRSVVRDLESRDDKTKTSD